MIQNVCPACGFNGLTDPPWSVSGSPSDEICPSCGIHFGYDDAAGGDPQERARLYGNWRDTWEFYGCIWSSKGQRPPPGWDPLKQLDDLQGPT